MTRTFAAAIACVMLATAFIVMTWPREQPRTPTTPSYSSTVYDPR
jgi:hypothetical protein